ncbi:hypothetical protein [Rufibacter sp. XAAS-G3-1]|uniref:hypothetical protein n=1 Tax=Rufibacter sp. XAAS-G3-1 TaxID=2729134 RepID=UPI0015E790B4|nr:hypothetical protein [Rufibacter sp. XAAS-G3-1]
MIERVKDGMIAADVLFSGSFSENRLKAAKEPIPEFSFILSFLPSSPLSFPINTYF